MLSLEQGAAASQALRCVVQAALRPACAPYARPELHFEESSVVLARSAEAVATNTILPFVQ